MKLALGTVQFGLDYGINNTSGKPNQEEINSILNLAENNNILQLDTSFGYGHSIESLSAYRNIKNFQVSSKFSSQGESNLSISEQVNQTLSKMAIKNLNILYYHHFPDIHNADLLEELIKIKENGLIENIGVSVYSNSEFSHAIEMKEIDCIQIPFNHKFYQILSKNINRAS